MKYKIELEKQAVKFINKQPKPQKIRLLKAISDLPDVGDIKAMQGHENYYRLRVGSYRVIYTINHSVLIIRIVAVGNRGDVYK